MSPNDAEESCDGECCLEIATPESMNYQAIQSRKCWTWRLIISPLSILSSQLAIVIIRAQNQLKLCSL